MGVDQEEKSLDFRRWRWRKWAVLLCLIVLYFVLAGQDRQMKYAPHEGYYPEGATSLLYFPAFPVFWGAFQESHAGSLIYRKLSGVYNDIELAVRFATGIRPTPARWQLWLGSQVLLAQHEDAWGACFHPGLLMHWATRLHQWVAEVDDATGITRFGDFHYVRLDNFLLVSTEPGYLRATLEAPRTAETNIVALDSLAFQRLTDEEELNLELQASQDLFLRGYLRAEHFTGERRPIATLSLPEAEAAPIITLGSADWEDVRVVLDQLTTPLLKAIAPEESPDWMLLRDFLHPLTDHIGHTIVQALEAGAKSPVYWMLAEIDTTAPVPLPVGALLQESAASIGEESLLQQLSMSLDALPLEGIPYYWGNYEGLQYPFWGEKLTLCLAEDSNFTYLTSQEPMMHALIGNTAPDRRLRGNMLLALNWTALGATLHEHRRQQPALWPGDAGAAPWGATQRLETYLDILEELGALELVGETSDGMLTFHGYLARALPS